ncbi:AAA family ATPase, partial [Serratia marcescens]
MFKRLRIEKFKAWSDTGDIKMAPITLFFGSNSSGKSSIGQLLMMLKQTIESPDRKNPLYSGGGPESAVDLGSYHEMVFQRKVDNSIKFQYDWDLADDFKIKDPITSQVYSGDLISFSSTISFNKNQRLVELSGFQYNIFQGESLSLSIGMEKPSATKPGFKATCENYTLVRQKGRVWSIKGAVRFYGFPDEVVAYYQNAAFVQELNLKHEQLFRSLYYLGPLRNKPTRLYPWSGVEPESVGYNGERTISAILASKNRRIGLGYKKTTKPFVEIIATKLKEMGLIDNFRVNPISENRQEYEVKVCTKGSESWVDLPDVGFGISQILPVLVQCFYAPKDSVILMEQPEIHLHPRAQAILADVMIDVIRSKENGEDRNIQLIIETHSEHFLRRLQRRIAEDEIDKTKVSAYFSDFSSEQPKLTSLIIDSFGNIQNWPE